MALLPFDDRDGVIWFDGKLVPWRDAKLHVLSHGLHYASCVFEGERAYAGKVFKLSEHSQRLLDSAAVLDMSPIPWSRQDIDDATNAVLKANNFKDAYVRPVMWRGSEMMAVSAQNAKPHLAIACWEWPSYFGAEARANGIRLAWAQYRRPAPDTAPTQAKAAGLYMICTLSKHKAQREGFDDALMLDYRGLLAEATGANLFLVQKGELHTPTPDCFLNGLTRQAVIGLARDSQIKVVERAIHPDELAQTDEIFLTGTAAEITPVGEVQGKKFKVGAVTHKLLDGFDRMVGRV
ncbi:MAG: branched-chain amino acid aminotransferase [Alphaproteobacteria bacterium]|nr:branched-chain amino acid aminotransferase [Alphaproteobacteria bacterium]